MILDAHTRLGAITALAFDATLTLLSEPIHRRSLANARSAIEERRAVDAAANAGWATVADRLPPVATIHQAHNRRRVLT
ncbi:MAG TPA: hypothetical protein VE081_00990 [Sporichthyaceae bacterium]|nr:hypothetical protein [Sporichthyaceae bacterium]